MTRRSLAVFVAISLLLAACGDDSDEPSGAAATEPAAADATSPPADTTDSGTRDDYGPVDAPAGTDSACRRRCRDRDLGIRLQ